MKTSLYVWDVTAKTHARHLSLWLFLHLLVETWTSLSATFQMSFGHNGTLVVGFGFHIAVPVDAVPVCACMCPNFYILPNNGNGCGEITSTSRFNVLIIFLNSPLLLVCHSNHLIQNVEANLCRLQFGARLPFDTLSFASGAVNCDCMYVCMMSHLNRSVKGLYCVVKYREFRPAGVSGLLFWFSFYWIHPVQLPFLLTVKARNLLNTRHTHTHTHTPPTPPVSLGNLVAIPEWLIPQAHPVLSSLFAGESFQTAVKNLEGVIDVKVYGQCESLLARRWFGNRSEPVAKQPQHFRL